MSSRPGIGTLHVPAPDDRRMRHRLLFLACMWVIAFTPFMLWKSTWHGRPLSEQQIGEYLHDSTNPRHIVIALNQVGDRMQRRDQSVVNWYPDIIRLSSFRDDEIRTIAARLLGFDLSRMDFHEALIGAVRDPAPSVRANAALSLARFGDPTGRVEVVRMLQRYTMSSPIAGDVVHLTEPGNQVQQLDGISRLNGRDGETIVKAPFHSRVVKVSAKAGQTVKAGEELATLEPSEDQLLQALRALYAIGMPEDLPLIQAVATANDRPERVRQQAVLTAQSIRARASRQAP